ncbi:MAG: D-glycero-alpha-D-manno-heptose-1,7-bisphosphate 7-phosphatase [Acidimicrobiales bacterium]
MSCNTRPAVFLDRDGVLNAASVIGGVPHPPEDADQVVLLEGVVDACAQLRAAGLVLVVVTNQPDIARGRTSWDAVQTISDTVTAGLGITRVLTCPHDDDEGCHCRKPLPGLLLDAAAELSLDLRRSTMVGDRWRDIDAGRAAGVATVWIDHGYAERKPKAPDVVVGALRDAVPFIVERAMTQGVPRR